MNILSVMELLEVMDKALNKNPNRTYMCYG